MDDRDNSFLEMVKADEIRAAMSLLGQKTFHLIEEPWTMLEEPWRIQWFDKRISKLCEVNIVGVPMRGDRYVMFNVYMNGGVHNYIFENEQYHFIEEKDETSVD